MPGTGLCVDWGLNYRVGAKVGRCFRGALAGEVEGACCWRWRNDRQYAEGQIPLGTTSMLREVMRSVAERVLGKEWSAFDYGMHSLRIGRENGLRAADVRPASSRGLGPRSSADRHPSCRASSPQA